MIDILGRIRNAVDCGCYDIEAVPAPPAGAEPDDCGCTGTSPEEMPRESTARVRVVDQSFVVRVDDDQLSRWFAGRTPRFHFRAYLNGELKLVTAKAVTWRKGRRPIAVTIDLCPPRVPPRCGKVCGTITDCRGNRLAGMRIRVYDVDLYDDTSIGSALGGGADPGGGNAAVEKTREPGRIGTQIGEGTTNACGEYCVCYRYVDYRGTEIDTADVRVVVGVMESGRFRVVRVSEIVFNAPPSLVVDLTVPGSEIDGAGEFLEYHRKLTDLGCNTRAERVQLTARQIDFIASEAGIPAGHLELLRDAYTIEAVFFVPLLNPPPHILAQIFYGLLRMGVSGPFTTWARQYAEDTAAGGGRGERLGLLLDAAIQQCVVDRGLGYGPRRANTTATGRTIWLFSFLYALITPLLPNRSSWYALFTVVFPLPANLSTFIIFALSWIRFGISDRLWQELTPAVSSAGLKRLRLLVQWAEISGFHAPAVALFYNDQPGLQAAVASDTAWDTYFSAAAVSPLPAGIAFRDYSIEVRERARAILGGDGVATWATGVTGADFPTLTLSTTVARQSAVRLSRLTTSAAFAGRLAAAGFTSARDIATLRWQDFFARLNEPAGSVQALYAFTKARETHAVSMASTLQLSPVLNAPFGALPVPFMAAPSFAGTTLAGIADGMFGSGSGCECEGRQSVFSPSAYLHALRRFLANVGSSVMAGPGGRALLDARRPEMAGVQLSYVNAYTTFPTIDANNEVLEDLVGRTLTPPVPAIANRQTTSDATELEVAWEYENAAVYAGLTAATVIRPWRFPFDLNHAKRRIFLDAIELSRDRILRLGATSPTFTALADAVLDFTAAERALIAAASPLANAFAATRAQLKNPLTMMDRAQVDFQDLYAVTRLTAIYDAITAPVMNPPVDGSGSRPCDPTAYTLNDSLGASTLPPLTDAQADRIHRFVRLRRALPWPMHVLDWAIQVALDSGEALFPLDWLGGAELVRRRLKLKPHEAVGLWGDLSTVRWTMPFVKTKPIASPWEQVFRVPVADLTVAAAARSAGISQQFAEILRGTATLDEAIASRFFRYGRLAKAAGLQPEDVKTYADLLIAPVFNSPEDTWAAIEDFEVIRRSGAKLAAAAPLYLAETDPGTPLDRREMLVAIEDLNLRTRISGGPFAGALAQFLPEPTVTVVVGKLTALEAATGAAITALDNELADVLGLPQLLTPPLSGDTAAVRETRILTGVATALWDNEIAGILCSVSGLDPASARRLADNVTSSSGATLTERLRALTGDGGEWTSWPSSASPNPSGQLEFLERGFVDVPDAVTPAFATSLDADLLAAASGQYQLRVKSTAASAGAVSIGTDNLAPGATVLVTPPFTVKDRTAASQTVTVDVGVPAGTPCRLQLEVIDPSGGVQPLAGSRLYSTTARSRIAGALEALEMMALAGQLATQWKLGADDLAALVRLQLGNAAFPRFPPAGTMAVRPLAAADATGFADWVRYARLVAAIRLARGEGRQILYDTIELAQSGGTLDRVRSGLAAALQLEPSYVTNAMDSLGLTVANIAAGGNWLNLFDLSRALQEYGVSATTFQSWGSALPPAAADAADVVVSLEAAARSKLSASRAGGETLRAAIDCIRALKRDVLADYLLAYPPAGAAWRTRKDISDYVLTDIEMEPCAQTSRTRAAIAGVQRLITQALAQAEPLLLTAEQELESRSILQYRLWEVRQRILLYPESWLKFGYHLHKTPEFAELERSLLQGDLTEDKAAEALTHFVEQLHGVGHLEIVGTCPQQEYDATGALSLDLLHVIGRTPAEPRAYYHRRRVDGAYWTPWEKIELDVDAEQIVPVVHNRQLHLLWLVAESTVQDKPGITKNERQIGLEDKYISLRLAWSVLATKGWRAKMLSKTSLSTRFGHYAGNAVGVRGHSTGYAEVHAWNQAVQDLGTYQLRPTLSDEGDLVIELFAVVQSTVVVRAEQGIAGWVYEIRDALNRAAPGVGWSWYSIIYNDAASTLTSLMSGLRPGAAARLRVASPTMPTIGQTGTTTATSPGARLIGTFRLTPDNLVEVRPRSAEFETPPYLTTAERGRTLTAIGNAVSRRGAFEFDDGSVELHTAGAFRTVLATAGTPVRVVVTRHETIPSERDPVFCRIRNRAFFAFKVPPTLPPAVVRIGDGVRWRVTNPFQTVTREHVQRAMGSGSALAPAMAARVGYGAAMASTFAVSVGNAATASAGTMWRFALAHHPQTIELLRAVKAGVDRLYRRETEEDPRQATGSLSVPFEFDPDYTPVRPWVHIPSLPVDGLEFRVDQAYSVHNWEALYHAPMLMAQQLMRIGRHEEARQWIARVFNPRDPAVRDPAFGTPPHPEKYWVFKPFVDFASGNGVDDFENLNPDPAAGGDPYRRQVFRALIKQWRLNPYNPHAVAAFRPQAYQLAAIFLEVENHLAWGDSLFAAPSAELVEEAARHYEDAEHVIGRPPISTGAIRYDAPARSVAQLETGAGLADPALGSVDLENTLSVGDGPSPHVEDAFLPDLAIGYFCLPPNPKIKELRDKIQDRLFKAHHCLDLLGNPRQLPLYDPPIDPGLLADAAMSGLNVSQAVMNAYTPRPHYRFRTLLDLTRGLVQHAVALGSGLLSAMEKRDGEALALLKATHEANVLERASAVRRLQIEDADAGLKALEATLKSVQFRQEYYSTREFMNAEEATQIVLSIASTIFRIIGQSLSAASSAAGAVPEITAGGAGAMGSPVAIVTTGGANFSRIPAGLGLAVGAVGDMLGTLSSVVGSMGTFRRRKEDWDFQAASAGLEIKQVNAQMLGAKIRQSIAEREAQNHEAQLEQSRQELDFLRTKQTSVSLYEWLAADLGATYYRAYQLAHSAALQAQRALQDELGTSQRFIGYGHWDGSRNGLQAGERLLQELLEMEAQYRDQNVRPVVKTVNVSLAQVAPVALAELKLNGRCDFDLPEDFWDRHAPNLYFRRFANVAVSVPAVVGPFGGVHGRLSIVRATYRSDARLPGTDSTSDASDLSDAYVRAVGEDDSRFVDQFPRPGDFIELSTGTRDTGLGSDEQKEDRYRPFENLGLASSWRLDISQRDNTFDLATISDVVMHVEYTARDGGTRLAAAARAALATLTAAEGFLVSLRHQFAAEWQKLRAGEAVTLDLSRPFAAVVGRDGRNVAGLDVAILARAQSQPSDGAMATVTLTPPDGILDTADSQDFALTFDLPSDGGSRFALDVQQLIDPDNAPDVEFATMRDGTWTLALAAGGEVDAEALDDVVVCISWRLKSAT